MAGNLTGLHTFANDVSPEPLSLLDTNYSAINVALNALATYANYYVDSGVANAMVVTVTANQTVSYSDGLLLQIQVAATNTGATNLNVNGLGSKNIVDQAGNALTAGMLLAGTDITVIYRSVAGNFQLLDGGQYQNWATGGASLKGPVSIGTPTSGTSFTVNAIAGTGVAQLWTDSARNVQLSYYASGAQFGLTSNHNLRILTNNATRMTVQSNGSVQFAAPDPGNSTVQMSAATGQIALVINGAAAGTSAIQLNSNATTGAQTATFSATNKPGSGTTSPDKWIPVSLDGTDHYIPAWL